LRVSNVKMMSGIEKEEYDVIVVGAGPAGISTAMHLIKLDPSLKDRMLVLEKYTHPRKKLCGGGIGAYTENWLSRLDIKMSIPSLSLNRIRFIIEQNDSPKHIIADRPSFRTVMREEFDEALFLKALELGISALQNEPVVTLSYRKDGVFVQTPKRELTTRVLVGADGAKGIVRRTLCREFGIRGPRNICSTLRFMAPVQSRSNPEHQNLEAVQDFSCTFDRGVRGYAWSFPTLIQGEKWLNTGVVAFHVPQRSEHSLKKILSDFLAARGFVLHGGGLEAFPIRWFHPSAIFSANRVVLVGDAAGVDPFWGEGISFSLGYGEVAAKSILRALENEDYSFATYKRELLEHEVGRVLMNRSALADNIYRVPIIEKARDHLLSLLSSGLGRNKSPAEMRLHSALEKAGQKANLLFELIDGLSVDYKFERSFKMFQKNLLGNRFLFILPEKAIKQDLHEKVLDICKRINMPESFLQAFNENYPDAGCVDFGFEEDERSSVYKVYLDLGAEKVKQIKAESDKCKPFLLFLGFKWDALDNTKCYLTKYTWYPYLPFENILEKLASVFEHGEYGKPFEIANAFLDIISRRISHEDVRYLEVTEENNQRRSFDINVYKAELQLKEVYPLLARIYQHYSIPEKKFHAFYNQMRTRILGHISGGINREEKDFFTLYYGAETITRKSQDFPVQP
jgi:flavin-dependent dehydrogenase